MKNQAIEVTSQKTVSQSLIENPFLETPKEIFPWLSDKSQLNQLPQKSEIPQKEFLLKSYKNLIPQLNAKFQLLRCVGDNQAIFFCCNQKCQNNALMCGAKKCLCKKAHKSCFYNFQAETFIQAVQRKIQKQDKLIIETENYFNQLIDKISEFQQRTIANIKYMLFLKQEQSFIRNVLETKSYNLKGANLTKCFKQLQSQRTIQIEQKKLRRFINHSSNLEKKFRNQIKTFEQYFKANILGEGIFVGNQKLDSKILIKNDHVNTLSGFFTDKKLVKMTLLYRGSEHNFSQSAFFDKCSNITHTIHIFQSINDKIIGGYTPIPWIRQGLDKNISDNSNQSFVFSITRQEKFNLTNSGYQDRIFLYYALFQIFYHTIQQMFCLLKNINNFFRIMKQYFIFQIILIFVSIFIKQNFTSVLVVHYRAIFGNLSNSDIALRYDTQNPKKTPTMVVNRNIYKYSHQESSKMVMDLTDQAIQERMLEKEETLINGKYLEEWQVFEVSFE